MHRIGIISDTHGLLRPEVARALQGCEAILHGGDINNPAILKKLIPYSLSKSVSGKSFAHSLSLFPRTAYVGAI